MCTIDSSSCYTITNETGFFLTKEQCQQGVYDFIKGENFSAIYQYLDDGQKYLVRDVRCIDWNAAEL